LWPTGDGLLKSIVTFPAFADSDLVVYSSCPPDAAARLILLAGAVDSPPAGALVVLEELVDAVELAVVSGVLADEVLLEELPHPARATMPISTGTNASRLRMLCGFD
jgi:hypothetical protein